MKKAIYFLLVILMIGILSYFFLTSFASGNEVSIIGWVKYSSPSAQTITIERESGEEFTLALTEKTKLINERGGKTNFTYFSAGTKIQARGAEKDLKPESLIAKEIRVTIPASPELD